MSIIKGKLSGDEFIEHILRGSREFINITLQKGTVLNESKRFKELNEYLTEKIKSYIDQNHDSQNRRQTYLHIRHSDLSGLTAKGIYLPYTVIAHTELEGADFEGAILDYLFTEGESNFRNATFDRAHLIHAFLGHPSIFDNTTFRNAILYSAENPGSAMKSCDFTSALLASASFQGVGFKSSIFRDSVMIGTNFWSSNLYDCDLTGSYVDGASFDNASLSNAKGIDRMRGLENAIFKGTYITKTEEATLKKIHDTFSFMSQQEYLSSPKNNDVNFVIRELNKK